jgi:hypothetical protein
MQRSTSLSREHFRLTAIAVLCSFIVLIFMLVALTSAPAALAGKPSPSPSPSPTQTAPPGGTQWTYAIYMDGDNSLDKYWEQYSLPGLLKIPAGDGLEIVAMTDRATTSGTELVELEGATQTVVATYPEKNFGDGATFQWFIQEVHAKYPSTHLAISVWDHGYGWRYFAADDSSGGDSITMNEFRTAVAGAGVPIDILAFDCCNMANTEVAFEASLTGKIGIMVASEETVPQDGYPYDLILTPVANDPAESPAQVATDMVNGWGAYYATKTWANDCCLSAMDIAKVGAATADLQNWSSLMNANLVSYKKAYTTALSKSEFAWATDYVDLGDLCGKLNAQSAIASASLRAANTKVVADVTAARIAQVKKRGSAAMTGLTLWWPGTSTWGTNQANYLAQTSFAQAASTGANWWAFLKAYLGQ